MNHGVPEKLREEVMKVCEEFFELPEEEKNKMGGGKHVLDPIRYGTSFNTAIDKTYYWRDFLKVFVFPDFYSPIQPTKSWLLLLFYLWWSGFLYSTGFPTQVH